MKKLIGLIAVVAIAGAMVAPATNASAAAVGGAVGACQANLPQWPSPGGSAPDCSTGDLPVEGLAVGGLLPGTVCTPTCTFAASVQNYSEPCFLNEPPLLGNANGELKLNGGVVAEYQWVRVGLTAVVVVNPSGSSTVDAGAGVAAFLPDPRGLGTCANPLPLKAHVLGAVFAAQAP